MSAQKRTGQPGSETQSATAAEPVKFTLDITISGLCLLVRRTKAEELLVLLPPVHAHGDEDEDMPEHVAVIGTHERYKPEGPFVPNGRFREFKMSDGTIELVPPLLSERKIDLDFNPYQPAIVDLSEIAERPPVRQKARIDMTIDRGEICGECGIDSGATWHFGGKKRQMATRLSWRINGLENLAPDGGPGVVIRFTPRGGEPVEFVVRPLYDKDAKKHRAAFYLYHTPETELPSQSGHPERQDEREEDADTNHHFSAFYDLFVPRLDVPLPELVPDEDKDDDEDNDEEDEGDEGVDEKRVENGVDAAFVQSLATAAPEAKRAFIFKSAGFHGYHGRLYTCTAATAEDKT
jgi:hypothetical protein